jgi:DNA-binding LacI/PurR family transcriptional regulator
MEEMLAKPDAPKAFFIVNADTHVGATNYLMTAGKAHRDRIAFASFDEMPYSPLLQFCRYSVSQPIGGMGELAAKMLLRRIRSGVSGIPEIARLQTTLIRH